MILSWLSKLVNELKELKITMLIVIDTNKQLDKKYSKSNSYQNLQKSTKKKNNDDTYIDNLNQFLQKII
jgi:hypothetical protein